MIAIAGHSLTANGPGALVGGVVVTVASGGEVLAGGTSIRLGQYTASSTSTSTTSSAATISGSMPSSTTIAATTTMGGMAAHAGGVGAAVVLGGLGALLF